MIHANMVMAIPVLCCVLVTCDACMACTFCTTTIAVSCIRMLNTLEVISMSHAFYWIIVLTHHTVIIPPCDIRRFNGCMPGRFTANIMMISLMHQSSWSPYMKWLYQLRQSLVDSHGVVFHVCVLKKHTQISMMQISVQMSHTLSLNIYSCGTYAQMCTPFADMFSLERGWS